MAIEIGTPTDDDVEELFRVDGRAFGFHYTPEEIADRRAVMDLSRFRIATDHGRIVSTAGSWAFDLTLPGTRTVPAAGVTWVSTQATHRRQGIMRQVLDAVHRDAIDRGEPVAVLTASESAIYGRFGYGAASHLRIAEMDKALCRLRPDTPGRGRVWFAESVEEARAHVVPRYETYRRTLPGEVSRSDAWWDMVLAVRAKPQGEFGPVFWLLHDDGYAAYRVQDRWNNGFPGHKVDVVEFVALTDDARGALWRLLFDLDLVSEYTTRALTLDDPLPFWMEHPRAVRTVSLNDWMWVKPLDVTVLLGARQFGTADRLVLEVGATRYSVDATGDDVEVRKVRARPDLITDAAGLGALLLGGVRVTTLARAGLLTAASATALRRGDAFFAGGRLPGLQTPF